MPKILYPTLMKLLLSALLALSAAVPAVCSAAGDIAGLESAARENPSDASRWMELGFAYSSMHKVDEAQAAFESAVRLNPSLAKAHYMLGLIYEKKGMKDSAIAAWTSCLNYAADEATRETARKHLHNLRS